MRIKIRAITSRFWKLQYRFLLIGLSYYKSVKKLVDTTRLRLSVVHLFLSARSSTLTYFYRFRFIFFCLSLLTIHISFRRRFLVNLFIIYLSHRKNLMRS